jgi:hypothetical protein
MDNESKGIIGLFAGLLLVIGGFSYVTYWGGLVTKPAANILEQKAREQDPLVIKTQQDRTLEIVGDIERKERELKSLEADAQLTEKASIKALRTDLIRVMGTLREDQIPDTVKAYLTKDN